MDTSTLALEAGRLIDEGLCRGLQVAWSEQGTTNAIAVGTDGLGSRLRNDSLFAVYCAGKPLLALCIAELDRLGVLNYDDRLPSLGVPAALPDVSLRDLLDHSAGIHVADGDHVKLHSSNGKLALAQRARPDPSWDSTRDAGYSESLAWTLLALAVECRTGESWAEIVSALVLRPLGAEDQVFPAIAKASLSKLDRSRLAVNCDMRGRLRPLLSEAGTTFRHDPNPGWGTFASASGLCEVVHRALTEPGAPGHDLLRQPARGRRFDQVMQVEADNRVGLMLDLADYGVVGAPSRSIGHTGLMGLSTVLHAPEIRTTACITFVGLIDGEASVRTRRPRVLRTLFDGQA